MITISGETQASKRKKHDFLRLLSRRKNPKITEKSVKPLIDMLFLYLTVITIPVELRSTSQLQEKPGGEQAVQGGRGEAQGPALPHRRGAPHQGHRHRGQGTGRREGGGLHGWELLCEYTITFTPRVYRCTPFSRLFRRFSQPNLCTDMAPSHVLPRGGHPPETATIGGQTPPQTPGPHLEQEGGDRNAGHRV